LISKFLTKLSHSSPLRDTFSSFSLLSRIQVLTSCSLRIGGPATATFDLECPRSGPGFPSSLVGVTHWRTCCVAPLPGCHQPMAFGVAIDDMGIILGTRRAKDRWRITPWAGDYHGSGRHRPYSAFVSAALMFWPTVVNMLVLRAKTEAGWVLVHAPFPLNFFPIPE